MIDKGCVAQPVNQRVLTGIRLKNESAVGLEVQTTDSRQRVVAIAEVEGQFVGLLTLCLQQVAVGLLSREGQQRDVVGQEMRIGNAQDVVNVERVAPDGVLTGIGLPRRLEGLMAEGQLLTLLVEHEVAVGILQSIGTISARCHTLDGEMAPAVSTRDAHHGLRLEHRVREVVIETDLDTLDGLQVLCVEHVACNLQRVDMVAR